MNPTQFDTELSEMFLSAAEHRGGGVWVECSCGIHHVAVDSQFIDPDEVVNEESTRCRHHRDVDGVEYIVFAGTPYVLDCEGCVRTARRYEIFLWVNRNAVTRYIEARIEAEAEWKEQAKLLKIIGGGG